MIRPAACDGLRPERSQIELEKHFNMATVTEQGAIYSRLKPTEGIICLKGRLTLTV